MTNSDKSVIAPAVIKPDIPTGADGVNRNQAPVEEAADAIVDTPEQLIDTYEKEEEQPYIVEYLGFNIPYYSAEEGTVRDSLEEVDQFVKDQIEVNNYKENTESYKKVLERTKKGLGIEKEAIQESVLERITGFIKAYNRIKEVQEKDQSKVILKDLFKLGKDRDYDADALALYLEEEYAKISTIS